MKKRMKLTTCSDMSFEEGYTKFIRTRKVMNVSDATIKHYNCSYGRFIKFFDKNTQCNEINKDTIYEFIEWLKEQNPNIKVKTINTYIVDIRAILNFLEEEGVMEGIKIKLLLEEDEIIKTYTDSELERLLKKPDMKGVSFSEYRNWVICNYLIGTGVRAATLCATKISDIDFINNKIALRRVKNKRQYIIPLTPSLAKILKEYLQYRGHKTNDEYLFCNAYNEPLVYSALRSAIVRYNHERGVIQTSIHLFRHTFAKKWIANGGDLGTLQQILGHSNPTMTLHYAKLFGQNYTNAFITFNPLEQLKNSQERKHITMDK